MYFSILAKLGSVHGRLLYSNTINVSQGKILLTFKAASLRECVRKCKQTACCEDAATVKGKDKKSLDCYLLGSNETNVDEERLLEMRITRSVEVSLFTLLFIKSKI